MGKYLILRRVNANASVLLRWIWLFNSLKSTFYDYLASYCAVGYNYFSLLALANKNRQGINFRYESTFSNEILIYFEKYSYWHTHKKV